MIKSSGWLQYGKEAMAVVTLDDESPVQLTLVVENETTGETEPCECQLANISLIWRSRIAHSMQVEIVSVDRKVMIRTDVSVDGKAVRDFIKADDLERTAELGAYLCKKVVEELVSSPID